MKLQILLSLAACALTAPADSLSTFTRRQQTINWAGAVQTSTNVNFVTGTITLPQYKQEAGRGASFWVGIDGSTCRNAILQTGVDFLEGRIYPWYEWFPDETKFYSQPISARPGDKIRMSVHAFSSTSGSATIENLTTRETAKVVMKDQVALCLRDAEWITENVSEGLVDFGVVRFSGTKYRSAKGEGGAKGARVYDVQKGGRKSTRCSVGDDVVCEFVRH